MMELVLWSFVVTLPPLVFSVVARMLSVLGDLSASYGRRRVALRRHSQPTFYDVARRVRRPESFGHGI
jgi:hypothetical protein